MMSKSCLDGFFKNLGMAINAIKVVDSNSTMLERTYHGLALYQKWSEYQKTQGIFSNNDDQNYVAQLIGLKHINNDLPINEGTGQLLADKARKCPYFELPFEYKDGNYKLKEVKNDATLNDSSYKTWENNVRNTTHHRLRLKGYMGHLADALSAIQEIFNQFYPKSQAQYNGFTTRANNTLATYYEDHPMWVLWVKVCDYIVEHLVDADSTDQSYAFAIKGLIAFLETYDDKFLKGANTQGVKVLQTQMNRLKTELSSAKSVLEDEFTSEGAVALLADIKDISKEATKQVQMVLCAFMVEPDRVYDPNISTWFTLYVKGRTYDRTKNQILDSNTAHANPIMLLLKDSHEVINKTLRYQDFSGKHNDMLKASDSFKPLEYNKNTPGVYQQEPQKVQEILRHIIPLLDKMTWLTALLSTEKVTKDAEIDVTTVSAMVAEAKEEVRMIVAYVENVKRGYSADDLSQQNSGFSEFDDLSVSLSESIIKLEQKLGEYSSLIKRTAQDDQKNNREQEYQDILKTHQTPSISIESSIRNTVFYSTTDNDCSSQKEVLETAKERPSLQYKDMQLIKLFNSVGGKNNHGLDPKKINYSGIYATKTVIEAYHQQYTQLDKRNNQTFREFLNSDEGRKSRGQVFFVKTPKDPVELFTEVMSGQIISQLMDHAQADKDTVITADLVNIKEGLQGVIQPYDSVAKDLHEDMGTGKNGERYIPYEWWNPKVYEDFILEKTKEDYSGLSQALFYPQLVYNYSNHSGNVAVNTETKKFVSRDQGAGLRDFGYLQSLMKKFHAQDPDCYGYFESGQFDQLVLEDGQLQNAYLDQWSVVDRKESLFDQMYKQVVRRYYQPINGLMMSVYAHAFSLNLGKELEKQFITVNTQLIQGIIDNSNELCPKITQHTGISGLKDAEKYAKNLYNTIKHHARFMQLEFYRNLKQQNITIDEKRFQRVINSGKDDGYIASLLDDYKKVLSIKQHLADSIQTAIEDKAKIHEVLQDKVRLKVLLNELKDVSSLCNHKIYQSTAPESPNEATPVNALGVVLNKISDKKMDSATKDSLCQKIMGLSRFQAKASGVLDLDNNNLQSLLLVALAKRSNRYLSSKTTTTGAQIKSLVNSDQGYRNLFKGCLGVVTNKAGDVTYVPYRALRDYVAGAQYLKVTDKNEKHKQLEALFCEGYEKVKFELEQSKNNVFSKTLTNSTGSSSNNTSSYTIEGYRSNSQSLSNESINIKDQSII
ncbi:hypothetical protein [Cysteiniphilum marinum]|uniref:hypothetical protein n=2 Tax=Fastidiosibacteraceae TaxID=2056687 RepID=UPI0017806503|nr:hypothetical protein [Cysteiniphilum marinum]